MATIGIMDSGVGGLSVFREIRKLLPCADYVYYADNAWCPYGEKDPEFIRSRCREITRLMISRGAQAMVIACNTATAAAISTLRSEFGLPFIGMEPAVKPAALGTRSGVIGVLATAGTLKGSNYLKLKGGVRDSVRVVEHVGNGFVELVVRRASFVVNIGVAVALPFPPVMALDAAYGFLLEFVHVEYEVGHGFFPLLIFSGDNGDSGDNRAMAMLFGCHHSNMQW